jgi:phosphatidylglycerophosphate synthase
MEDPTYRYICEDKSILLPFLKKYLWIPAFALVPEWLSANTMTLAGNLCAWVSFAMLLALKPENSAWFIVPAIGNFLYMSIDNMDGMQARRSGRSSPLGEFLDHWGDCFNIGLICFGYGIAMKAPPWFVIVMLALGTLTCYASFWEQQVTGKLILGETGTPEGVMYVVTMYMLVAVFGHEAIATKPLVFGMSLSNLTLYTSFFCTIVLTVFNSMRRVGKRWGDFLPPAIIFSAVGIWFASGSIPLLPALFVILFAGGYLSGRVVVARVLHEPFRPGDFLLYILIAAAMTTSIGFALSPESSTLVSMAVLVYLIVRLAIDFWRVVNSLSHHLAPGELLARIVPGVEPQNVSG